jgi:hypothetical protein
MKHPCLENQFRVQFSFWNTEHSSLVEAALKEAGFDPGYVEDWRVDEEPPEDFPQVFMWLDAPYLGEIELIKAIVAPLSPMTITLGGKVVQDNHIHCHISELSTVYGTPAIAEGWLLAEGLAESLPSEAVAP